MENNKPEKHFRFGGVRGTVWRDRRKGQDGRAFDSVSVTLDRAYRNADGEWQNTASLRENDIPKAIAALQKTFVYLTERVTDQDSGPEVEEEIVEAPAKNRR